MSKSLRKQYSEAKTPAEKRVLIAKDVIAQVKLGRYKAYRNNSYFEIAEVDSDYIGELENNGFLNHWGDVENEISLQEVLDNTVSCEMCGIGGVFASKVSLGNACNVIKDVGGKGQTINGLSMYDHKIHKNLKGVFTLRQLELIETAFEGRLVNYSTKRDMDEQFNRAVGFAKELSASDAMIAIMENIIENKGFFKP